MLSFILRRFLYALLLLIVASVLIFSGLRVAPGDVTGALVSVTGQTEITIRNVRERFALDKPLATQYVTFLKNVLSGDPGNSFISGARISDMIRDSGAKTLKLGFAALIITYVLAIPLGVAAAWRRNSLTDQSVRLLAVLGMGIPNFFLAVLLIQLFALKLKWLPVAGSEQWTTVVLPAVVLAMESMAINMRLTRSSMLEELSKDYVRTLKAKGLAPVRVVWLHALRNALVPVIAFAGIVIPLILGYTLIVEVIFRYEGIGFQLVEAIQNRDYALAQTLALLFTAVVIFSNFLADIGHQLIDPRVRERGRTA
jgi:ABC-type dipeptide/oligopeptide/nickel transport system permease component